MSTEPTLTDAPHPETRAMETQPVNEIPVNARSRGRGRTAGTYLLTVGMAAALILSASGCARKFTAERDGKKMGEAICDLRNADSKQAAQDAASEITKQAKDLANKYTMFTAQDRRAIQENVSDLAEHYAQGNTALMQQDLAVLQRNIKQAKTDVNQVDAAAWDGIQEGLADCTQ